jgi:phosphoenolpyruvate carboxykinase (ATP)
MSTKERFFREEINSDSKFFSETKSIIETAFYGNNVVSVTSLKEAYKLAKASPGTIATDMPIYMPEELGLVEDSKILVFNDGSVHGRCASARRILGEPGVNLEAIVAILKEAVYKTRFNNLYHAQAYIGLNEDFMVRARLLIPEGHENLLYNWLLNFQHISQEYTKLYKNSKCLDEGDIYIFADPNWSHPDYPLGLAFFDPEHNCAAILGMRYFGELKKGTLTLAWGIANRNGYASCHGGLKRYNLSDDKKYVLGFFGLSGSGKSTLTHAKHKGKYDISILHDDALVISTKDGSSVALEPSYFDKTADYPLTSKDNKFLLSIQNCGVTIDAEGNKVLVTEDIRNKNGRALKSKLWSPNRVDKFEEKVNAIIWLMKDPTLPPVLKINDPILSATMGAVLATKRTSAERLAPGIDPDALVIEPYANPFRTYPLINDYQKFKELFSEIEVDCYIFNTGYFIDKKVTKEITLESIEGIVEGKAEFKKWADFNHIEIMEIEGFIPNMEDVDYLRQLRDRISDRAKFIESKKLIPGSLDRLPQEALYSINKILREIEKHLPISDSIL